MFQKITLSHIRPYQHVSVELLPGINVLFGPNGAGKTTILEALCVLSTTKSYRANRLFDLVSHNLPHGEIIGETSDLNTLKVEIYPRKHSFYKNGDRITRTSQFLHGTRITVLAPEHLHLISGSGEKRRQFLDHLLTQKHPILMDLFKINRKTLKQKQALLKQNLPFSVYQEQVEPWNHNLIETGEEIRKHRKQLLQEVLPEVGLEYREISQTKDQIGLIYRQREEDLAQGLTQLAFQEHRIKRVLVGAHRDDFDIHLRGQHAHTIASQGERASVLLALKFAEMEYLTDENMPVMLLDDVGVTLDDDRRKHLFERLEKLAPQTLMTTPNHSIVENARGIGGRILMQEKSDFQSSQIWK